MRWNHTARAPLAAFGQLGTGREQALAGSAAVALLTTPAVAFPALAVALTVPLAPLAVIARSVDGRSLRPGTHEALHELASRPGDPAAWSLLWESLQHRPDPGAQQPT